jgi:hypothetical protein
MRIKLNSENFSAYFQIFLLREADALKDVDFAQLQILVKDGKFSLAKATILIDRPQISSYACVRSPFPLS